MTARQMPSDKDGIQYYENIVQTMGNTPMVKLKGVSRGTPHLVLAKVESFNPGGSVKDRVGLNIIEDAEKRGELKPGGTIVEATSGNTGVGLAMAAAIKGYKCIFTLPDKQSQEKVSLLKAYGAQVIVCPTAVAADSPDSYYEVARRKAMETPNAILANQYFNPANPEAHYKSTGPEIWEQTNGKIDIFVAGAGTGGTMAGVGRYLKEKNPNIKMVAVDPEGSILRDYFYYKKITEAHPYKLEGIGEDIIPGTTDFSVIDDFVTVSDRESFIMTRALAREEGMLMGGSAGAAIVGAQKYIRGIQERKVVVVLLPDTGERHLSKVHNDDWMTTNGYFRPETLTLGYILDHKHESVPDLVSVGPNQTVEEAIEQMRHFNISQLPVVENDHAVGKVTENGLIRHVIEDSTCLHKGVGDLMESPLPVLEAESTMDEAISHLGRGNAALLVRDAGKLVGILSRFDFVDYLSQKR